MSVVAILGAGALGAAVAHKLAERARVREVRLIDEQAGVAAGKALDLRQTGPIEGFDTRLESRADALDAVGSDVIVITDLTEGGEWQGEAGLDLVRRLLAAGTTAPLVFAGPGQVWLMEAACAELGLARDRAVGTASSALIGAARALVGLELGGSALDVQLTVAGRPPECVVGWSCATTAGSTVTDRVPAHRLLAISDSLRRLWPPGPQAIGAATARVVEGLLGDSRQVHHATTVLDGELGTRGVAAMLPLELGSGRVLRRLEPTLSPQERTAVMSTLTARR